MLVIAEKIARNEGKVIATILLWWDRRLLNASFPRGCEGLNSNPSFFLCLNTSFFFTNYQPIQRNDSFYNRAVRIMHRYCIMQHGFYVSITIYQYFSWLEFKWHNDLEKRHQWIWIASACILDDSDFTNDEFLGHYPILNHRLAPGLELEPVSGSTNNLRVM